MVAVVVVGGLATTLSGILSLAENTNTAATAATTTAAAAATGTGHRRRWVWPSSGIGECGTASALARNASVISVFIGFFHLAAESGDGAVGGGLDRSDGDPRRGRSVHFGQIAVVTEHDHLPLPRGQAFDVAEQLPLPLGDEQRAVRGRR